MPSEQRECRFRVYSRTASGKRLEYFDTNPQLIVAAAIEDYPQAMAGFDSEAVGAMITILVTLSPGEGVLIRRSGGVWVRFSVYRMTQEEYDDLPYPEDIEEDEADG